MGESQDTATLFYHCYKSSVLQNIPTGKRVFLDYLSTYLGLEVNHGCQSFAFQLISNAMEVLTLSCYMLYGKE